MPKSHSQNSQKSLTKDERNHRREESLKSRNARRKGFFDDGPRFLERKKSTALFSAGPAAGEVKAQAVDAGDHLFYKLTKTDINILYRESAVFSETIDDVGLVAFKNLDQAEKSESLTNKLYEQFEKITRLVGDEHISDFERAAMNSFFDSYEVRDRGHLLSLAKICDDHAGQVHEAGRRVQFEC